MLYYPVGSLHGKLAVTAKRAPGCPAPPWRARPAPHSFALSRRPSRAGWVQPRPHGQSRQKPQQSRLIKPNQGKRQFFHGPRHSIPELPICVYPRSSAVTIPCLPEIRELGGNARFSRQSRQIKPNQTISSPFACSAYFAVPATRLPEHRNPGTVPDAPRHQASIKAKTPVIVLHQGSSRQTPNFQSAPVPGHINHQTCQPHRHASPPKTREPSPPIKPRSSPIKAKTPAIKAHQASSRQTPNFP